MLTPTSVIFLIVLCGLMGYHLIKSWLSSDKAAIWSPITVIILSLIYYVVLPSFEDIDLYGANAAPNQYLFYLTAVVFYGCVIFGFSWKQKTRFKKWNNFFNHDNALIAGIILFIFALACYVPFRGFRTTIWAEDAYRISSRTGLVSYFIDLIAVFCAACGLLYMQYKKRGLGFWKSLLFYLVLYLSLVFFIVGGFRYRLVWLILTMATVYHLFPKLRRPNYILIITIATVAYLGFAIMDTARRYGTGIDRETAMSVSLGDVQKGAGESVDVCCFSIAAIDYYSRNGGYVLFEPIATAALMPIPRAIFPNKPDGGYMRDAQMRIIGDSSGGAAFLCFAEAYISFGMFGVIIYGLFFGWLAGVFWDNYKRNRESMGAILLLALFNGFCYAWISRGYLGGNFNDFLYFVIVPFWLVTLFRRILPRLLLK